MKSRTLRIGLELVAAVAFFAWGARGADIASFTGGAVFSSTSGIQTYFAQSTGGSRPLLQIYVFLADEHFIVQLRSTGTGSGSMDYQVYAHGAKRQARGSYVLGGKTLRIRASKGVQLVMTASGGRIRLHYQDASGTFAASGRLQKFAAIR